MQYGIYDFLSVFYYLFIDKERMPKMKGKRCLVLFAVMVFSLLVFCAPSYAARKDETRPELRDAQPARYLYSTTKSSRAGRSSLPTGRSSSFFTARYSAYSAFSSAVCSAEGKMARTVSWTLRFPPYSLTES